MKQLTFKLAQFKQWILSFVRGNTSCKHLNKKEVWREYPDAYLEFKCLDCGERIFEDMYND